MREKSIQAFLSYFITGRRNIMKCFEIQFDIFGIAFRIIGELLLSKTES